MGKVSLELIKNEELDRISQPGEKWTSLKGYGKWIEEHYLVSNHGRMFALKREFENGDRKRTSKAKVVPLTWHGSFDRRYYKWRICDQNGKRVNINAGPGVYYSFFPEKNKPTIDHIDRDPTNNRLENLREATFKEQAANKNPRKKKKEAA